MPNRHTRLPFPCRWVAAACLILAAGTSQVDTRATASELRQTPIVKAARQARPSVVNIRGEKTISADAALGQLEAGQRVNGMGTGVVVDPRGYIVTNYHVVDGVRQIQVTTDEGQKYTARLVNRDPETDLAIIKVDSPEPMTVIHIGSSSDLMPGEPVVAVGNAYGYEHTVSRGIISALHRDVQVNEAQFYEDLIQTDAAINPGNSGGPLINIDGQMIGINVAVRAGAQGIGFAIPVDKAMEVAARLLKGSSTTGAWHGLEVTTNHSDGESELVVSSVAADSPAAEAGVQAGDVVQSVDGKSVCRALDFQREMVDLRPGDEAKLSILREKKLLTADITLAKANTASRDPKSRVWDVLGLELKPIPTDSFRRQYNTRYRGGLQIVGVRPTSPADDQGIRRGDVLVGMHIWETVSLENVNYILNRPDFSSFDPVQFYILRGTETLYGYLPVTLR